MASSGDKLKETLQKKSLPEIEAMISANKKMMSGETDLLKLSRLNTELSILLEIRDRKINSSGHNKPRSTTTAKPELKSFDDYLKSKK